ncbi:hypothetical protein LVJ82_14185 [Vitreoscilla massiliensis]|uniref:Uncharacterized protein n=1 Tax=Vitreoscilla massiliensis TaxID=1689272 RepID=A0ABY4E592_9NEIS|nr:hypothetical protein [Vitreoscilla massiliensis]UOO88602.1 hypothetical protein LVJ82_14185 [Vitreoscilla massiliensis]
MDAYSHLQPLHLPEADLALLAPLKMRQHTLYHGHKALTDVRNITRLHISKASGTPPLPGAKITKWLVILLLLLMVVPIPNWLEAQAGVMAKNLYVNSVFLLSIVASVADVAWQKRRRRFLPKQHYQLWLNTRIKKHVLVAQTYEQASLQALQQWLLGHIPANKHAHIITNNALQTWLSTQITEPKNLALLSHLSVHQHALYFHNQFALRLASVQSYVVEKVDGSCEPASASTGSFHSPFWYVCIVMMLYFFPMQVFTVFMVSAVTLELLFIAFVVLVFLAVIWAFVSRQVGNTDKPASRYHYRLVAHTQHGSLTVAHAHDALLLSELKHWLQHQPSQAASTVNSSGL